MMCSGFEPTCVVIKGRHLSLKCMAEKWSGQTPLIKLIDFLQFLDTQISSQNGISSGHFAETEFTYIQDYIVPKVSVLRGAMDC